MLKNAIDVSAIVFFIPWSHGSLDQL
jgi:hypothetical protein